MQRLKATFSIAPGQLNDTKQRILNWASRFSILLFLDSNRYSSAYGSYECMLAAGSSSSLTFNGTGNDPLAQLQQMHATQPDWFFGHIAYDFKDYLEPKLSSTHSANTGFPQLQFFIPDTVCHINTAHTTLTIESFNDPTLIFGAICETTIQTDAPPVPKLQFTPTTNKESYIAAISKLHKHIADGDCYEINYCTEGFCLDAAIDPLQVFNSLNILSPAPFAAFYRLQQQYLMCASPERYIRKSGTTITSQPIKGTARRGADSHTDELIKAELQANIKERAENVMIVDLVRNDLARCCEPASVRVDELFGIYTFPQVHQMISTVSGTLRAGLPFTDAIRYSFPMGSMTGAPKYKVMELIEQYEDTRRELFAGTVGYITPSGDFDFNVVIRSLFYNADMQYLSYQTGGAITYDSDAEQEWQEMRLKAWALERIFS